MLCDVEHAQKPLCLCVTELSLVCLQTFVISGDSRIKLRLTFFFSAKFSKLFFPRFEAKRIFFHFSNSLAFATEPVIASLANLLGNYERMPVPVPTEIKVRILKITKITVRPVLSDHIKQDIFWLFRQVVAYCCMIVVQKAHAFLHYFHSAISSHLSIAISISPELMVTLNWFNCMCVRQSQELNGYTFFTALYHDIS